MAKKVLRYNISKNQLVAADVVTGSKTVEIGGLTYKVRLLTGGNGDVPATGPGGEWDKYMLPIHASIGPWATYTNLDLGISGSGNGAFAFNQERGKNPGTAEGNVVRGFGNINGYNVVNDNIVSSFGWRPVLELVV